MKLRWAYINKEIKVNKLDNYKNYIYKVNVIKIQLFKFYYYFGLG